MNQIRDSRTSPTIDDIGSHTQEFLIDKSVCDFLDYETVQDTCVNGLPDHVKDTLDPLMGTLSFNKLVHAEKEPY